MHALLLYLLVSMMLLSCASPTSQVENVEEIPLVPLKWVREMGGIVTLEAPLHTVDHQYHQIGFTPAGERTSTIVEETLFPTGIFVLWLPEMDAPQVFMARSPHGSCRLQWDHQRVLLHDPCYGSYFDTNGHYLGGPSLRHLDALPFEVRGDMLWVTNHIVYGAAHP